MARPLLRRRWWLGCALMMLCVLPGMAEAQDKPIGEAPEERDADDIFLRGQRVLLGRGDVVLDFGQFYSRSDTLQLAVVDNSVQLATLEQSVLTTLLVGRIGLLNETEVYAGASFHRLEDRLVSGATNVALRGRSVPGNVVLGVRRTLLREGAGRPDIVATFDSQIPTDDDRQYVAGGGLAFVKSVDPVVLFAASSYQHAFRRILPDGTSLGDDDAFALSLGYGLALNDTIAISTAASGVFTRDGIVDAARSERSESFSLRFALTSALAAGLYVEPSVTIGLSGPGQSFTMGVTLPLAF